MAWIWLQITVLQITKFVMSIYNPCKLKAITQQNHNFEHEY